MQGIKIVEFQGFVPSAFCALYFADQGAEVTLVSRAGAPQVGIPINKNILNRNKKCISIDFKNKEHFQIILKLLSDADVVIDPYRPGVLEKLKLGPKDLEAINRKIVFLRISGYGQSGAFALRPGHDLNYIAKSGIMKLINKQNEHQFPYNYLANFVSASLGITGTLGALHERERTGTGKVVDCSLANGYTYYSQNIQSINPISKVHPSVFELRTKGKTYVYNTKDNRVLPESELLKLIKEEEYYCSKDRDIEISIIKEIEPPGKRKLVNPFSSIQLSNSIKSKGEDDQEIFARLRAKL